MADYAAEVARMNKPYVAADFPPATQFEIGRFLIVVKRSLGLYNTAHRQQDDASRLAGVIAALVRNQAERDLLDIESLQAELEEEADEIEFIMGDMSVLDDAEPQGDYTGQNPSTAMTRARAPKTEAQHLADTARCKGRVHDWHEKDGKPCLLPGCGNLRTGAQRELVLEGNGYLNIRSLCHRCFRESVS